MGRANVLCSGEILIETDSTTRIANSTSIVQLDRRPFGLDVEELGDEETIEATFFPQKKTSHALRH